MRRSERQRRKRLTKILKEALTYSMVEDPGLCMCYDIQRLIEKLNELDREIHPEGKHGS